MYGPPGTGKTMLVKAVAAHSKAELIYASASSFVEIYVGVGAKKVREMFKKAKNSAPAIIFIDELDAIGARDDSKIN
jgi:cell division protease FtsH